jgi:hypothetical protein
LDVFANDLTVNNNASISVNYDQYSGRLLTFCEEISVSFNQLGPIHLSSVVSQVVFLHSIVLHSTFQIDQNITIVKFNDLALATNGQFIVSNDTTVIASQIRFPDPIASVRTDLSLAGTLFVESWNLIEIGNLSVISDSIISVSIGLTVPLVRIGGKWTNRLRISVTGTVFPAIQPTEEIEVVCFRVMPCLIADLERIEWDDRIELNCSGNCAVIRLKHEITDDEKLSSKISYLVVGICGGIIILLGIVTMICMKRESNEIDMILRNKASKTFYI